MSWKDKAKEWGGGDFTFLTEDGESVVFVVADEPVLLQSNYKGQPQERIGCPVVTEDGFTLLIVGKRVLRKLSKFESKFKTNAFMITRFGLPNDTNAKYPIEILKDENTTKALLALVESEYKPQQLEQAIEDVKKVLS